MYIIEVLADYFKDKYNNTHDLMISLPLFYCDHICIRYVYPAKSLNQKHNNITDINFRYELIISIGINEDNINLYLYDHDNIGSKCPHTEIKHKWHINDPKCILEIEEYTEKHINHIKNARELFEQWNINDPKCIRKIEFIKTVVPLLAAGTISLT